LTKIAEENRSRDEISLGRESMSSNNRSSKKGSGMAMFKSGNLNKALAANTSDQTLSSVNHNDL
jgi:hypothetical protein